MRSLKYVFLVQGEGRGHMTQALALCTLLTRAGHRVCRVLVGHNRRRDVPDFFLRKIDAPVAYLDSPSFACDAHNRAIRLPATLGQTLRRSPRFRTSLRRLDAYLREDQPDVVVNFYEPLGGLYYAAYRPALPMVAIAHQYLFLHPAYRFPPGHRLQRTAARLFTRLTAVGATRKLALSLNPIPEALFAQKHGAEQVTVLPPLLRDEVFQQTHRASEPFFLVYLLNSGYADAIIRWHRQHPEHVLHCFWDNRGGAEVEAYDATLTFHRLDDEKFLALMARCRGLITTAGFETVGEAMYLGKPVLAVPVEGHFEQFCNSLDAAAAGAGVAGRTFDIDRLLHFLPTYQSPAAAFHRWVHQAEPRFLRLLENVVHAPAPHPDARPELSVA